MLCDAVIKAGGSPHDPDKQGWTPLHRAAHAGHLEAVRALLKPEFGPIRRSTVVAGAGCSSEEKRFAKGVALEGKVVTPLDMATTEEIRKALKTALPWLSPSSMEANTS
mmetsp:Transcript_23251/g.48669  ORF Transcript_23251/g.48669 Transcript_23251/m.48669 type:complete len:109 (+) Transcript_23251:2099-2425(+)